MRKSSVKVIGIECLYMVLNTIMACISSLIQCIGETPVEMKKVGHEFGAYTVRTYQYNNFFYILGIVLYLIWILISYRYFISKQVSRLNGCRYRITYGIVSLIFSIGMVICIWIIGVRNPLSHVYMTTEFYITCLGFSIFTFIYMIVILFIKKKDKKEND